MTARHCVRSFATKTTPFTETCYVHPLSQMVLEYLQRECADWVLARQLDRPLTLHRDGTFMLASKIWTSYDPHSKKHWLSYQADQVHHRFLLQDNMMPGTRKTSLPERVHRSVDDLIQAVEELE